MASASRERHFVVSSGPVQLASILGQLAPGDGEALAQGRVFVDGKRADPSTHEVTAGSRVTWVAARLAQSPSGDLDFTVLDRRDRLIVVAKPAAWSSEPDRSGHTMSLREQVKNRLKLRDVHVVTRLDSGVSGLVLIAVGEEACRQSTTLQNAGQITKHYLAIAAGPMSDNETWNQSVDGTRSARSECHPLAQSPCVRFSADFEAPASLLRIDAVTGRHHQIRVHAAINGRALLGDRRYGGPAQFVMSDGSVRPLSRPLLHAWRLEVHLPGQIWTTTCDVPADMRRCWGDLGGTDCWPTS
jgi:23S rRNA pseudouridine1911/1915/1917 synthase